ncbi:hypothetical protein DPMN_187093 [Dreissena polymorpha]|uniref:Uncharacterized protein n=1 Tax=Dreissena polymorpha TaxID=45954 RepID=A0A9D4DPV9_DREPO|nr:hypothetical protein DPMN_187093 [Dreissena polymorpha]
MELPAAPLTPRLVKRQSPNSANSTITGPFSTMSCQGLVLSERCKSTKLSNNG